MEARRRLSYIEVLVVCNVFRSREALWSGSCPLCFFGCGGEAKVARGSAERLCTSLAGPYPPLSRVTPEVLFKAPGCRNFDNTADLPMSSRAESSRVLLSCPETSREGYFNCAGVLYSFLLFFFIFSTHVSRP
jgi:hypothetical protein